KKYITRSIPGPCPIQPEILTRITLANPHAGADPCPRELCYTRPCDKRFGSSGTSDGAVKLNCRSASKPRPRPSRHRLHAVVAVAIALAPVLSAVATARAQVSATRSPIDTSGAVSSPAAKLPAVHVAPNK